MKRIFFMGSLLSTLVCVNVVSLANPWPAEPLPTLTLSLQQPSPSRPAIRKNSKRDSMKPEAGKDSTVPKNRKQPRLRPDSLRRGGATRIDTVRH